MLTPHKEDPNYETEKNRWKRETDQKHPSKNTFGPHSNIDVRQNTAKGGK